MMGYGFAKMPPKAPLPMAQQDFSRCPKEQASQERSTLGEYISRTAAFAPAILLTLIFSYAIFNWLSYGGVTPVKAAVVMLVAFTFIWVSLSAAAVALGISRFIRKPGFLKREKDDTHSNHAQRVALLTPIYNEDPADVFGNAWAMLQDLSHGRQQDSFTLFILSDTKDPAIARLEEQAFFALQETVAPKINVFYRRRADNTDKKVGNIADWIENWGAAYDAMLILDADSLMSGAAIRNLARELAAHPEAGLIQSFPALIGSRTLFGRMQQFSNAVYGWLLAEGLSVWSQSEGNYWGHNAIIRVRAFADSARLPHLPRRRGSEDLILSHDFVEAGMLRRAGWGVRFLPRASGSFEETPQTVIDYCLRDRRWCKGNLQHLRLLTVKGFHPVSRFHLLQGAFAFLMSPAWFALLIVWSLVGTMSDNSASYFTPLNPLYPVWPEQAPFGGSLFLFFIYGMLLLPKVLGAFALGLRRRIREAYGGWGRFVGATVFEIFCSILYAPIMMVQQTIAVVLALTGKSDNWTPQNRGHGGYSWRQVLRFHVLEVVLGTFIAYGVATGSLSLWLVPIAFSLVLAPILSKLSAVNVSDLPMSFLRLNSPHDLREPRIVTLARSKRMIMASELTKTPVAAE